MSTKVKDFMKQPVVSLALPNDVGNARDLMKQKDCHAIPLVEVGENKEITVRGIVTSEDLMGAYDDTIDVRQLMTKEVQFVDPQADARTAAGLMLQHKTHHLVVMEEGRMVGMVSSLDFVGLVAALGI